MFNKQKIHPLKLKERLYIESMVNRLFDDIINHGDEEISAKSLMEQIIKEEKEKSVIEEIIDELMLAPKFLFSFGTGITSFYEPINKLLYGSGFQLTEYQTYLLIITAVASLINDVDTNKLINKLKEEGIYSVFDSVIEFITNSQKLINIVTKKSLGVMYSLSDILAFTSLLVPTMKVISEIITEHGINNETVIYMMKGVILSASIYGIKSVLKKVKNKLK